MKTKLIPPAAAKIKADHLLVWYDDSIAISAWGVVNKVAPEFRYRGGIVAEVKRDLLRFSTIKSSPVYTGIEYIYGTIEKKTTFWFPRRLVDEWLDFGGRSWILAELESRSGDRVVAFSRKGRRQ